MEPRFFASSAELRLWFEKNHNKASELLVGYYKKGSGRTSIAWAESVDQALCFGWIDGIRRSLDEGSYSIRFTPRKPSSTWSLVNAERVGELRRQGLMRPEGLRAFEARRAEGVYSYEQRQEARLTAEQEAKLRANQRAWAYFQSQPPGYRKVVSFWVTSAKREETRERRLRTLIEDCEQGRRVRQLVPPPERTAQGH